MVVSTSVIKFVKWSIPTDSNVFTWPYDLEEWGGLPPVLLLSPIPASDMKIIAELNTADNSYWLTSATNPNNCGETARPSVLSVTGLLIRQGFYQIEDLMVWAKIDQYSSVNTVSVTSTDGEPAFPLADYPRVQIFVEPYAAVKTSKFTRSDDKSIKFNLDSSAQAGVIVTSPSKGSNKGSFLIGNIQLEAGFVGASEMTDLSEMALDLPFSPNCMNPAIFPSVVHSPVATDDHIFKIHSLGPADENVDAEMTAVLQSMDAACQLVNFGDYETLYTYGLMVISSDYCFLADQTWYSRETDTPADPKGSSLGNALLAVLLVCFFLGLGGIGYIIWRKWHVTSVAVVDENDDDNDRGGTTLETPNTAAQPKAAVVVPSSVRIQPRGSIRPPRHLAAD